MERFNAIVTAGGTAEPIDDVRVLSNISTGRFGHELAVQLTEQGAMVTELCPELTTQKLGNNEKVRYEHFTTADSLKDALLDRSEKPDIILHAAAVADYKPVRTVGKISSDLDEMTIQLKRNPKIIAELRSNYGSEAFLAGFKLLSNVPEADLIAAATKQLKSNRLNMVVANDLQNLKDGGHPVIAVTPEGGAIPFTGARAAVARELVSFILKRADVKWFKSVLDDIEPANKAEKQCFHKAVAFAHYVNLLTDESGNVSSRAENGRILVSPRQTDKSQLKAQDAIVAHIDLATMKVTYAGERKPSIDTGMIGMLYNTYPELESIIHFHNGWGRMNAQTRFPYPCGVQEEADEIIAVHPETAQGGLAVDLIHHGFILGLKKGDTERLAKEWWNVMTPFLKHLDEVGTSDLLERKKFRPIFNGSSIAGIIYDDPDGAAVFLHENSRGSGLGSVVVEQLKQRHYTIQTVEDCGVRDYYKSKGFSETYDHQAGIFSLAAPHIPLERKF